MNYIIILALLAVALISLSVAAFLEFRKFKKAYEVSINDLQSKLDQAVEEREAKLNEVVTLLGKMDSFLISFHDLTGLEYEAKNKDYPDTMIYDCSYDVNQYYEGQIIKMSNGVKYKIITTGKQIRVEKI